ncbi:circadian clock protein KaiC [Pseudolysobacter antarcticus]|uniref:non-specific serine/threonine protein kinase n=1 Tax=Pseudolysobacter antarcticus TaxID=2511995 RepID=A0A411HJA9_9GAMM|nr:ATPase domain-containing protein [Pseudolysobacter antarcticus]QBB70612.1 circadian clock protein KaiC [Pseudolysobacter antarcticus]
MVDAEKSPLHLRTGIAGLDNVLGGGLLPGRLYLVEGEPGTGKTTIAMHFLHEGAKQKQIGLYVTLSETESELRACAEAHGWSFDEHVTIMEVVPPESLLDAAHQQSLLYSSDLELGETTRKIFDAIERIKPQLVVLDSLSELRLLAQGSLRYRRQILSLKHYFARHGATVILLDDLTTDANDKTVHSVAHGVVILEQRAPDYGAERRRLRVLKYRGQAFRGGYHDFAIKADGVHVFPRLIAAGKHSEFDRDTLPSGVSKLDALLEGGIDTGSSTLILGPAGGGKSTLALLFAMAAIVRGEKVAVFLFDEELGLLVKRMKVLGIDLQAMRDSGKLHLEQVDAAEMSPGEFAHRVCACVDIGGMKTVIVDSLNGYQAAMSDENQLILHMHELLQYLNRRGATTFLTVAQHGLIGDMKSPVDLTYLADTVILMRYFEALGVVRRAISVVKKRTGGHEPTLREFGIDTRGLWVGEILSNFHGVLRGTPTAVGSADHQKS